MVVALSVQAKSETTTCDRVYVAGSTDWHSRALSLSQSCIVRVNEGQLLRTGITENELNFCCLKFHAYS